MVFDLEVDLLKDWRIFKSWKNTHDSCRFCELNVRDWEDLRSYPPWLSSQLARAAWVHGRQKTPESETTNFITAQQAAVLPVPGGSWIHLPLLFEQKITLWGLKKHRFFLLECWGADSKSSLRGRKSRCGPGCVPPEDPVKNPSPCRFQLLEASQLLSSWSLSLWPLLLLYVSVSDHQASPL